MENSKENHKISNERMRFLTRHPLVSMPFVYSFMEFLIAVKNYWFGTKLNFLSRCLKSHKVVIWFTKGTISFNLLNKKISYSEVFIFSILFSKDQQVNTIRYILFVYTVNIASSNNKIPLTNYCFCLCFHSSN